MKQFLSCALVIASLASTNAYALVVDKFNCHLSVKNNLNGSEVISQNDTEGRRIKMMANGWPYGEELYNIQLNFVATSVMAEDRLRGEYFTNYYVAVKRDDGGQIVDAKFFDGSWLGGAFCRAVDCSVERPILPPPPNPFLGAAEGWKDMILRDGLPLFNHEDFRWQSRTDVDASGSYNFTVKAKCDYRATILEGNH
jgi:hypothetical protein